MRANRDGEIVLAAVVERNVPVPQICRIVFFKRGDDFILKSEILTEDFLEMIIQWITGLFPPFLVVVSEPLLVFPYPQVLLQNWVDNFGQILGGKRLAFLRTEVAIGARTAILDDLFQVFIFNALPADSPYVSHILRFPIETLQLQSHLQVWTGNGGFVKRLRTGGLGCVGKTAP